MPHTSDSFFAVNIQGMFVSSLHTMSASQRSWHTNDTFTFPSDNSVTYRKTLNLHRRMCVTKQMSLFNKTSRPFWQSSSGAVPVGLASFGCVLLMVWFCCVIRWRLCCPQLRCFALSVSAQYWSVCSLSV